MAKGRKTGGRKAGTPHAASVFISHSRKDKTFVNRLAARLKEAGIQQIWYDTFDLKPATADLHQQIRSGIKASDYFLIVLSSGSEQSQWVSFEVQEAVAQGKPVIPLIVNPSEVRLDFRDNPFLNELLHGGRHMVIQFGADFERGLSDVLLVLAPDRGRQRVIAHTIDEILNHDDPDMAELAMSHAALKPDEHLPELLPLFQELWNDAKRQYRVVRSMTYFGEQALAPLFALLLRQVDVPSVPIPDEIPHDLDRETGQLQYTGESFTDVVRHIVLTGGNRAWAAQIAAQRCLIAVGESAPHLRGKILTTLTDVLSDSLQDIGARKGVAVVNDTGFDVLRLCIETAGRLAQGSNSIDPWMIHEFATTSLWGKTHSNVAKHKLGSYIVECLSRIATPNAMKKLVTMSEDEEIRRLFFESHRAPNPWDECFARFGNAAVDMLVSRLQHPYQPLRPFLLLNLARIPHPRGLRVVLDAALSREVENRNNLLILAAGQGVAEISDAIVRAFAEGNLLLGTESDVDRSYLTQAAVTACRSATDRALVTRVCTQLASSNVGHVQCALADAIAIHRIYKLYDVLGGMFEGGAAPAIRGGAAIALSKVKEIDGDRIVQRLATAEERTERPYLSVALAHLGDNRAIAGLVAGLKTSFLEGSSAEHELYANALSMLPDRMASEQRTKWYKRI